MRIILKPIISEKSINETSAGKYVFKVATKANKHEITQAIRDLYKVDVLKVNTIKIKPEARLVKGRFRSLSRCWKKAVITLKKGQKIPGFEIKE